MKRAFLITFAGIVAVSIGIAAQSQGVSPQRTAPTTDQPPGNGFAVGRYQVIPTTEDSLPIILLDTITGDTWTYCLTGVTEGQNDEAALVNAVGADPALRGVG